MGLRISKKSNFLCSATSFTGCSAQTNLGVLRHIASALSLALLEVSKEDEKKQKGRWFPLRSGRRTSDTVAECPVPTVAVSELKYFTLHSGLTLLVCKLKGLSFRK